ncbi:MULTISPECIES: PA3496 family putative envelope integrity protein [unclassified Pseudomonas]|uniref:PA3496 family putative envelope integrity protein n=1 Tax=unclassified Pseudomonas TaxID=196821 RepID=UPI0034DCD1A5
MPRHYDEAQQHAITATAVHTSKNTRRQQEDQRRMEFRRAIESYSEQRQLAQELSDYFDVGPVTSVWQQSAVDSRRNVQQVG